MSCILSGTSAFVATKKCQKKARVVHPWLVALWPGGHRKAFKVPDIVSAIKGGRWGGGAQIASCLPESPNNVPSKLLQMSLEPELAHMATSHCKGSETEDVMTDLNQLWFTVWGCCHGSKIKPLLARKEEGTGKQPKVPSTTFSLPGHDFIKLGLL